MIIPKAGHIPSESNSQVTNQIIKDYISSSSLVCINSDSDCSLASKQCEYMNHCHNRGVCENGFCVCDSGYGGADCFRRKIILDNGFDMEMETVGDSWMYFTMEYQITDKYFFDFKLRAEYDMDLYINYDLSKEVSHLEYDMKLKNMR